MESAISDIISIIKNINNPVILQNCFFSDIYTSLSVFG